VIYPEPLESNHHHQTILLCSILILSLSAQVAEMDSRISGSITKVVYKFLIDTKHATCSAHRIFLHFIALIIDYLAKSY
jgi:hypothetical protein